MSGYVKLRALVLSTTPPHPREYGNRNRIYQMIAFLKSLGYEISFVLYPFDEEWARSVPDYYRELVAQFEFFSIVPNSRPLHQRATGFHHEIDEWWDDNIRIELEWLFARQKFDAFVVNYTFLSRAFLQTPAGVAKILETHDLFSDRRETFEAHGVEPEFFYTNRERERIAFERADIVIAIKDSEAKTIASFSPVRVISIPYWDTSLPKPVNWDWPKALTFDYDRPLRVGFVGALNSVNIVNMRRFLERFSRWVRLYNPPIRVIIAGNVCRALPDDYAFVEKLGRVEALADFYHSVDAIVAPLEFSTGIKIKVGEALGWDKPVIATHNAFDGFRAWHPTQSLATVNDVCDRLVAIAMNEEPWEDLVRETRRAARSAKRAQDRGIERLQTWLHQFTKRIVVIVSRPFWNRNTLADEQTAQTIELLSHLGPVLAIVTAPGKIDSSRVYANVQYVQVEAEEVGAALDQLVSVTTLVAIVLAPDAPEGAEVHAPPGTPVWRLEARQALGQANGGTARLSALANAETLAISPLRYLPITADKTLDDSRLVVVMAEQASEWEVTVADYVHAGARTRGKTTTTITMPFEFEFNQRVLSGLNSEPAQRWVLIGHGEWFPFVEQIAYYRGNACMIVARKLIAPCVYGEDGRPSLSDSIDAFLDGDGAATTPSNHDSGWSKLWGILTQRMTTAAASMEPVGRSVVSDGGMIVG
jgi:glycosyltransferase involved in cell wall biosynthesis